MRLLTVVLTAIGSCLAVAPLALAQTGPLPDRSKQVECFDWVPESCPEPMDPLSRVSFTSSSLRDFRRAAVPPWRRAVGPEQATVRLVELHQLAMQGLRPALPNWRRDAAAKAAYRPFASLTVERRFPVRLPPVHIPDADRWAAVIEAVQVGESCSCQPSQSDGPGAVPNGAGVPGVPLTLDRSGSDLLLSWSASCSTNALDYSIHEGTIGVWYDHTFKTCMTGGATNATVTPGSGSHYYLVVPVNDLAEGSYGNDSAGAGRPPSSSTCRATLLAQSCP